MAIPGREQVRAALLRYVELPGARFLKALKLTPNAVTLLGFAVSVVAAYLVGSGWLLAGGVVFLLGGGLDLMDGALARLTGTESPFGALLDSVFDRLGEAALFVGLAVYGLRAGFGDHYLMFFMTVLLLALIFSQGVSYLRARGEGLGVFTRAGVMTRPERVVLLGIGLLIGQIVWVLLAIAVVSCFTLFQRMFTIRHQLDQGG
ncbi:MAG: CDP-alcohol phosphatidyltransferase family protein [Chloroflexi bacterium]|nr:CDP-alcohol phosphatidyltransferase family protein [Chloroflexota bacterium]MCH8348631.1 CDP-alcohol phosphatidyltransferase family protein [Chloroflexota bacterium]MCI0785789.1 CDP-alcohol phosphatidyltransferase family protein [Chloroflexota bacterium]MCI0792198.1 CDP-alcohol phosphatidyltransferase family protein [Chloroflexota bacterium]MCI0824346.1 CDP-alcohol phosphatidyltransferase family protein [Chloroflexota bacterium]